VGAVHTAALREQYTQELGESSTKGILLGTVNTAAWREQYTQPLRGNITHRNLKGSIHRATSEGTTHTAVSREQYK
jgi:hypothetical protein